MNAKSYAGLSLDGLTEHIASALLLHCDRQDASRPGTRNDAIHTVAWAMRAYHGELKKLEKQKCKAGQAGKLIIRWTKDAKAVDAGHSDGEIQLEHAIPVCCITNVLFSAIEFEWKETRKQISLTDAAGSFAISLRRIFTWLGSPRRSAAS